MIVNKIKILNTPGTKSITFPLGENFDFYDREDSVLIQEEKIVEEIIGKPLNYELLRFSMKPLNNISKIKYNFYLQIAGVNNWGTSYSALTTTSSIQNNAKGFTKSFFKMDFYNSKDIANQKIYFTIILPTTSGIKMMENGEEVIVPKFELDHVGNKEGYYIYWYEDVNLLGITEMFFKSKFFNAITGKYIGFLNKQKSSGIAVDDDFYYKLKFDYAEKQYLILNNGDSQINEVNWYQYLLF